MGVYNAMVTGVLALRSQSNKFEGISDNIANANTDGYKRVRTPFKTLVTQSILPSTYKSGGVLAQPRMDVDLAGHLVSSSRPTDIAISGRGFIVVSDQPITSADVGRYYTRAGSFRPVVDPRDSARRLLQNTGGAYLLGWPTDSRGQVVTGPRGQEVANPSPVLLDLEVIDVNRVSTSAEATTQVEWRANLPAETRAAPNAITFLDSRSQPVRLNRPIVFRGIGQSSAVAAADSVRAWINARNVGDLTTRAGPIDAAVQAWINDPARTVGDLTVTAPSLADAGRELTNWFNDRAAAAAVEIGAGTAPAATVGATDIGDLSGGGVFPGEALNGDLVFLDTPAVQQAIRNAVAGLPAGSTANQMAQAAAQAARNAIVVAPGGAIGPNFVNSLANFRGFQNLFNPVAADTAAFRGAAAAIGAEAAMGANNRAAAGANPNNIATAAGAGAVARINALIGGRQPAGFAAAIAAEAGVQAAAANAAADANFITNNADAIRDAVRVAATAAHNAGANAAQVADYAADYGAALIQGAAAPPAFPAGLLGAPPAFPAGFPVRPGGFSPAAGIAAGAGNALRVATQASIPPRLNPGSTLPNVGETLTINLGLGAANPSYTVAAGDTVQDLINAFNGRLLTPANEVNGGQRIRLTAEIDVGGRFILRAFDASGRTNPGLNVEIPQNLIANTISLVDPDGAGPGAAINTAVLLGDADVTDLEDGQSYRIDLSQGAGASPPDFAFTASPGHTVGDLIRAVEDFNTRLAAERRPTGANPFNRGNPIELRAEVTGGFFALRAYDGSQGGRAAGARAEIQINENMIDGGNILENDVVPGVSAVGEQFAGDYEYAMVVYDSLGAPHRVNIRWKKREEDPNLWEVRIHDQDISGISSNFQFNPADPHANGARFYVRDTQGNLVATQRLFFKFSGEGAMEEVRTTAMGDSGTALGGAATSGVVRNRGEVSDKPAKLVQIGLGPIHVNSDPKEDSLIKPIREVTGSNAPFGDGAPYSAQALAFEWNVGRPTGLPGSHAGTGLDGLTQFSSGETQPKIESYRFEQNGMRLGRLSDMKFDERGFLHVIYDNGQVRPIYRIPVATFADPNALINKSGNLFQESASSGQVQLHEGGRGGAGKIRGATLESSNVEISSEFSDMIIAQQSFTANTRVVTTSDRMLNELSAILR